MTSPRMAAWLLIVILPLGLLAWLGYEVASREESMREFQVQSLVTSQLKLVDASLQTYFHDLERELVELDENSPRTNDSLRDLVQSQGRIRQALWFDATGKRQHPPTQSPLTRKEKMFLERTRSVIPELQPTPQSKMKNRAETLLPESRGWHIWYSGSELIHLFWRQDKQGELIGFELEPMRLLADMIARLPAGSGEGAPLPDSRIRLIDASGQVLYQWGGYHPAENETYLGWLPLSPPLGSWRLEFFGAGAPSGAGLTGFNILVGLIAVGTALGGLAFFLYREQQRETRLAGQRVNFVNQVSHELRTPLTNIRLYAELLEDRLSEKEDDPSGKIGKYLDVITQESQRLSRLIANVLSFSQSKHKSGKSKKEKAVVDSVIENVLTAFRPALEERNVNIQFRGNARQEVLFDPDALEQIMNNLISNMEKYAASGKQLDITSVQKNGRTEIRVRDYGPGIPKKEQDRIFEPFYRISHKLTDGVTGAGIGLSIARELAEKQGGSLNLQSVKPGACFQLILNTPAPGGAS